MASTSLQNFTKTALASKPGTAALGLFKASCRALSSCEQFIFVCSTGRCGTNSLTAMLESVPGVVADHEATPRMGGEVLRQLEQDNLQPARNAWNYKTAKIRWQTKFSCHTYTDTTHFFIKSFLPMAVEEFKGQIKVIHMTRDTIAACKSYLSLDQIPGRSEWLLDYRSANNLLQLKDDLEPGGNLDHDFHRLLWYWYETELRFQAFKREYSSVPTFDLQVHELNDPQKLKALSDWIGFECPSPPPVKNTKKESKQSKGVELPSDTELQEMKNVFMDHCAEKGYSLEDF